MIATVIFITPSTIADVALNTEIVIGITGVSAIDLTSILVTVDEGSGLVTVYQSEAFQNNWVGELINNNPGPDDDFTLVLIRPIGDPIYAEDNLITVDAQAILV